MKRPEKTEYSEYYEGYVSSVAETDIVAAMSGQLSEIEHLFALMPEEKGGFAYAPGKWTIKELLGHLIDGERVFSYRALRISRRDQTPLSGFDQDLFIANADFNSLKLTDLVEEFLFLRRANIIFFRNLSEEKWSRTGTASDNPVSVRALAYILVGHVRHHENILKEKYLNGDS